ncbi:hypothetical protein PC129_g7512 [Phytophthora cactorum]|uniref:Homeodomain-like n=1 Tax=Phytophthora cactorum TaxID=29920 RepID=A0A329SQR5_9STRA|nr:hypothetical protein Pcac1_g15034 [Phytophthora cactorum]KAG2828124.1 hypothetical protein PC111_g8291 [Phytophthora cactorum]KAG2829133.1 hypothetical protein PC112_g8199 [Phytophthora cactorum]KAG2860271.1 hypothetical protein PC113_g8200 [Phytophthora cactorum]KAG2908781.1 hypothetical protein PC114_g10310 [Phytophthora cactorum]
MPASTIEDLNAAVKRVLSGEKVRGASTTTTIPYRTLRKWVAKGEMGIFRESLRRGPAPLLSPPAEQCLVGCIAGRQMVRYTASRKEIVYKAGTISSMATGHTVGTVALWIDTLFSQLGLPRQ